MDPSHFCHIHYSGSQPWLHVSYPECPNSPHPEILPSWSWDRIQELIYFLKLPRLILAADWGLDLKPEPASFRVV